MAAPPEMLQFMSIPVAVLESGSSQKSYEEVRIDDYLQTYQATGKPPEPCPQEPTNAQERAARNLPPLFQPTMAPSVPPATEGDLPDWQLFVETKTSSAPGSAVMDRLLSITAAQPYANFSFEQLRYHAYLAGRIHPPPNIPAESSIPTSTSTPTASSSSSTQSVFGGNTSTETMLSISSKPEFSLHSFEELRLASLRANGRDVTSNEITGGTSKTTTQPLPTIAIPGLSASTPGSTSTLGMGTSAGASGAGAGSGIFGTPSTGTASSPFSFSPAIRF